VLLHQPSLLAIETSVNKTQAATPNSARRLAIQSRGIAWRSSHGVDGNAPCRASFRFSTEPSAACVA
jgi:hypothetical protein